MKLLKTKEEFQERIMDLTIEIQKLKKFKKTDLQENAILREIIETQKMLIKKLEEI